MLSEHTLDQLRALRLDGMVRAIEDQATSTAAHELPFDDRLTMLVQSEVAWRGDPSLNPAAQPSVPTKCACRHTSSNLCTTRQRKRLGRTGKLTRKMPAPGAPSAMASWKGESGWNCCRACHCGKVFYACGWSM